MPKNLALFLFLLAFTNLVSAQPVAKQVAKGVVNGAALELPKPEYPKAAQAIKASGEVKIQVVIDEQGNVISAKSVSGHPLLVQSAEQAAWKAKFKPTLLSGVPVKVTGIIIYNFLAAKEISENAQPDEIWAIGLIFGMLEKTDEQILKQMGDDFDLSGDFADLAKNIPEEIAKEKPLLEKLAKSAGAERQHLAGEVGKTLEKYFTPNELEVYQTGLLIGSVIGESFKSVVLVMSNENAKLDTAQLKIALMLFRDKLNSSKQNLSSQTAANFTELAALSDTDLNSPENLKKFIAAVSKIMDSVSFDDEAEKAAPKPETSKTKN